MKPELSKEELELLLAEDQGMARSFLTNEELLKEAFSRIGDLSELVVKLEEELRRTSLKVELLEDKLTQNEDSHRLGEQEAAAASDLPSPSAAKSVPKHPFEISRKQKHSRKGFF